MSQNEVPLFGLKSISSKGKRAPHFETSPHDGQVIFVFVPFFSCSMRKNIMQKNSKFYNGPWSTLASFSGLSTSLAFGWDAIWPKQLLLVDGTWQPLREIKLPAILYIPLNFFGAPKYPQIIAYRSVSASECLCPKEGYGCLAELCAQCGWRMYRIRPKIHLQQHIVFPG